MIKPVLKRRGMFLLILIAGMALLPACFAPSSSGGGGSRFRSPRKVSSSDVALPDGYRIEPVATGLTFPSGVTFDDAGNVYLVEAGYSYGEVWATPRLLKVEPDGGTTVIATGSRNGPWNGVAFHQGNFYVAEGGESQGGRILKITPDGKITPLIENLPSVGDHHTNGPVVGPDGALYFAQGTATNSAVVGEDNAQFGWLSRYPEFHDVPCQDVVLTGKNFKSKNPLTPDPHDEATTGAFSPFGKKSAEGEVIRGQVPCSGAILRLPLDGGKPELVAWGLRNPFGLAFSPDGRLFATENSYDDRGSRPVHGTGDLLWEIEPGRWYGWPDFHGVHPLNEGDHYDPPGKPKPELLIAAPFNKPIEPAAILEVHSSSNGFDFSRSSEFGYVGEAFIAQFGDMAPGAGKVLSPVGFKVIRVDLKKGVIEEFAVNRGRTNGPASRIGGGGLERPVAARFDPSGKALYLVDFGVMTIGEGGEVRLPFAPPNAAPEPRRETGVLWRITKDPSNRK